MRGFNISIYIDKELYRKLVDRAKAERRSISNYVCYVLAKEVNKCS